VYFEWLFTKLRRPASKEGRAMGEQEITHKGSLEIQGGSILCHSKSREGKYKGAQLI